MQSQLKQKILELERTAVIRWFCWFRCINKVKLKYEAILSVLIACSSHPNLDGASRTEAIRLKLKMHSFKFLLTLFVLERDKLSLNIVTRY